MKKILYFFPFNPIEKKDGSKTRALELLYFFKEYNYTVDLVYEKNADNTFLHDEDLLNKKLAQKIWSIKRRPRTFSLNYLLYKFHKIFLRKKTSLNNFYFDRQFNQILKQKEYDFIIISYATYAGLIKSKKNIKNAKTIIDTHDFLTAQIQDKKKSKIGGYFQDEIRRLSMFDEVWAISSDELYLYSQFLPNVRIVPFIPTKNIISHETVVVEFDILYVASENPHNLRAAAWFFSNVYPLLDSNYRIAVVGKISKHIKDYKNVKKFDFIDDLSAIYQKSKISICPMLSGTGVKIKVLESLSFGLPVVTQLRGVDGLPNKTRNGCFVAENEQEFASYIDILLTDTFFYKNASKDVRAFYNENYSKDIIYKNLLNLLK